MSDTATIDAPATPAAPAGGLLTGTPPPSADTGTPAAKPTGYFGEHIAKEGQFQEGWAESLRTAGFERLANKAMTAKDEATLFKMLDDTIGYVGKKQIGPVYPTEASSVDEILSYRQAAGVPNDPAGYQLKPENLPEGVHWSDEDAGAYAEIFHKHHVPAKAAQELLGKYMEGIGNMVTAGKETINGQIAQFAVASEQTFQQEWGNEYSDRLEANRAFVQTRLKPEEMADPVLAAALSHPAIVRMVDEARRGLRDAPLPGVGQEVSRGSMSPRQQAVEIQKANPRWNSDPDLSRRVMDLYALEAAQAKRRSK